MRRSPQLSSRVHLGGSLRNLAIALLAERGEAQAGASIPLCVPSRTLLRGLRVFSRTGGSCCGGSRSKRRFWSSASTGSRRTASADSMHNPRTCVHKIDGGGAAAPSLIPLHGVAADSQSVSILIQTACRGRGLVVSSPDMLQRASGDVSQGIARTACTPRRDKLISLGHVQQRSGRPVSFCRKGAHTS